MVLRSCFCYKKCPRLSTTKRTITHARNPLLLAVKPKYPGVLNQQYVPQRNLSVMTISNKFEKIEIPTATKPIDDLDQLIHKQLDPKQTAALYQRIAKRNPVDIFNMCVIQLDTLDYTQLRPFFIDAAAYWPTETIHKIMLLCGEKYVPWRLDLLQSLQSSYVLTKDLNLLIDALPKSGLPCDVLPFYNTILNKCLKQNQLDHMRTVMNLMKQRCIDPDTATSNILTRMQLNNCTAIEESLNVYHHILEQGIKPNQVTFNTFIKHACQHQHWDTLNTWLDKMQEKAGGPNSITVRILFKSYVDHSASEKVIQAFDRVSKAVPVKGKEKLLNTGVARLLKLKQTKAAMDLLDKTFQLDQPLSIYSYNLLLQTLCLDGKVETAEKVLNDLILRDKDNIPKPDIVSFTTLIHGLVRNSSQVDPTKISTVYQQLLDQGLQSNNVLQSVMLYGLIRSHHHQTTEDITKIKSMFESILANKQRTKGGDAPRLPTDKPLDEINIYNMMMDFYFLHYHHSDTLRNQVPKEPFNLLQEAVETKKIKPTVTTLNILVRGLAILNKDLNGAEKMVSLLKEKGVDMDEKTVWYLTKSAYSQGQITRARQWIEHFESQNNSIQGSGLLNLKSILTKWDTKQD